MNLQQRAAMQMAVEALESCQYVDDGGWGHQEYDNTKNDKAITALREALAQPQEPLPDYLDPPRYPKQPQGGWVDLTDDDIEDVVNYSESDDLLVDIRAVIAKFKEKNTPPVVPQGESVALYFGLTPDHTWLSTTEADYHKLKDAYRMKVYTTPPSVEAAIEATKEKAAKVCEEVDTLVGYDLAAAIRSMK
jgi:hypothetical protein